MKLFIAIGADRWQESNLQQGLSRGKYHYWHFLFIVSHTHLAINRCVYQFHHIHQNTNNNKHAITKNLWLMMADFILNHTVSIQSFRSPTICFKELRQGRQGSNLHLLR